MGNWPSAPLTASPPNPQPLPLEGPQPGTPGARASQPQTCSSREGGARVPASALGAHPAPQTSPVPRDSPAGAPAPPPGRGVRGAGSAPAGAAAGAAARLRAGLWLGSGAGRGWTGSALPPSRLGDTSPAPTLTLHLPRLQRWPGRGARDPDASQERGPTRAGGGRNEGAAGAARTWMGEQPAEGRARGLRNRVGGGAGLPLP